MRSRSWAVPLGLMLVAAAPDVGSTSEMLKVGDYVLVDSERLAPWLVEETYRATVTNGGGPRGGQDAVGVGAVAYSRVPWIRVIDRTLTFGNVRAGTSAASRDTFSVRRPIGVPLASAQIQWRVSWRPDVILPAGWAGTWRFDLRASDGVTGSLESHEITTDIVRPDDALGLALVQEPARCKASLSWDVLELGCRLDVTEATCVMRGQLQLRGSLTDDTLQASGEWHLSVGGDCGPLVRGGSQRIELTAARTSLDTTVPYESATSLAAKLLPPSPLLEPPPAGPPIAPVTRADCKDDGWRRFNDPPFVNQGQCVKHAQLSFGR